MSAKAYVAAFLDRSAKRNLAAAVAAPVSRDSDGNRTLSARPFGIAPRRSSTVLIIAAALLALALPAGASATPPTVSVEDATNVSFTTAETQGEVDPSDHDTAYHFEYVSQSDFEAGEWASAVHDGFGFPLAGTGAASAPETPPLQLTGLTPSTTYHLRLTAESSEGLVEDVASTFTTKGPITAPTASNVDSEAVSYLNATATGKVDLADSDPGFNTTVCRFEYLTQAEWEANGNAFPEPEGAPSASCAGQSGAGSHEVSAPLANLAPAASYHLRLVAANGGGTTATEAASTFTTLPVAKPTITGLAASELTTTSAHLSAEVDPGGTDPAFDTSWHFECIPSCGGLQGGTLTGAQGETELINDAKGLLPNINYTLRLIATNAGGTRKATTTFSTLGAGPQINPFGAGPLTPTSADINAQIDPNGLSTTYYFEWGTEDCSVGTCQSIPSSREADAGSSPYFTYVSRHLSGLQPSTTYHFRILARNSQGIAAGPDLTFTTPSPEPGCANAGALGTDFLPDCRAWEMVSSPEKSGSDVIQQTGKTHVSTDGNAVTYSAAGGGFGDHLGTSFDSEYIARRTAAPGTNGWATSGINPLGGSLTFTAAAVANDNTASYVNAFTPDLSAAVYRSWRPLTEDPSTSEVTNFYRVGGLGTSLQEPELLTGAADGLTPVSPAWAPVFKGLIQPKFVGASTDLSHVVFESRLNLTADAPEQNIYCQLLGFACEYRLYESAGGETHLIGRVPKPGQTECDDSDPANECEAALLSSQAGISAAGSGYSQGMVSEDGRRIFFQVPAGVGSGAIYMREDGVRTIQLAQDGHLWAASTDGSRVFFVTSASLLPNDLDSKADLYMYDTGDPANNHLTLISASTFADGNAAGVVGASADGQYVYFVCGGQLLAGGPPADIVGLYVWHNGNLAFIGSFQGPGEAQTNGPEAEYTFEDSTSTSRVSPDGRHLLFMTHTDEGFRGRGGLAGYEQNGNRELYLYDAESGRLRCASCDPGGTPASANAITDVRRGATNSGKTSKLSHALSDDGRYVFFSTAQRLLPEDTNGTNSDAYSYDSLTGALHLISSGTDDSPSYFIDATDNGSDAFFVTRQRLSDWDHDTAYDLYDARVGGGLPEPAPVPSPCAGESCLPGAHPAPGAGPAASQATGPANPPPPACPKGKIKKHGKCVKKHQKKSHKRHADANRGASK